jgi:DNA-binding PadR family transcriptional regulator
VGLLCAARRLSAWTASIELRAVSHLSGRRAAYAAATGDRRQADHVGDEVAAALTLTCRAADRLVSLAAGVTRLPAAAAALAAGRIDMPRAIVFTDELAGLGDVAAAAVAALVAPDAAGLTTSELRRMLHRAVLALDPEAATKRREKAQRDARVEVWAEPAGTAALAGRDMPPAEVLAADKHIDATARDLKAAGAEGTLEQLRARVFLTLLSGQPIYTLLPGQDRGTSTVSADGRSADGRSADSLYDPPGNDPNADDHAGDYLGRGDHGRGNHDGGNHDGGDHDGGDHGADGDGDNPGRPGPGGARRPGPGRGPGPSGGNTGSPAALTGSVNLTVPLMTWLGLTGQPGEAAGHGPLDATACRDLTAVIAAGPGSRWCLTITSPDGTAVGHGCAETAHPPPRGPAPPGVGPPGQRAGPGSTGPPGSSEPPGGASDDGRIPWLAGIKINWLETGACGHARETFAYQPSRALRHLIKTRNRTCTFPGCRRPAIRCESSILSMLLSGDVMSVRHALLALLSEGPSTACSSARSSRRRTGEVWPLNVGQVYTTLQRLERDGLVESDAGEDGPQKGFRITADGEQELAGWLRTPPDLSSPPPRDELVIKVLVAMRLPGVDVHEVVQVHRRYLVELMQQWTRLKEDEADDSI